jgi:hypothetical protein
MQTFIDWAKQKYAGKTCTASDILNKFGSLAKEQKICCMEPEFEKLLKSKNASDSEISTLRSMFDIYNKEAK